MPSSLSSSMSLPAFCLAAPVGHRTTCVGAAASSSSSFISISRLPTTAPSRRARVVVAHVPTMGLLPPVQQSADVHDAIHQLVTVLSTRGDIGPLADVDLEIAALIGAISGGALLAGFIIVFILRV